MSGNKGMFMELPCLNKVTYSAVPLFKALVNAGTHSLCFEPITSNKHQGSPLLIDLGLLQLGKQHFDVGLLLFIYFKSINTIRYRRGVAALSDELELVSVYRITHELTKP
jgi:hypothetical protein